MRRPSSAASRETPPCPGCALAMLNWPPISAAASNRSPRGRARPAWWRRPGRPGRRPPRRCACARGRAVVQLGLVAGARVDQAARQLVLEGVVQAGLVAGDAGVDLVGRPLRALFTKSASASKGRAIDTMSAQPSASTCSATSGVLMRLLVTSGVVMPAPQTRPSSSGDPGKGGARHAGGDGGHARLVPADAGVDDAGAAAPRPCPAAPPRPSCCRRAPGRSSTGGR
jgi:hypothetical protein